MLNTKIEQYQETNLSFNRESTSWVEVINAHCNQDTAEIYSSVCKSHQLDNKWILMINPEDEKLESLSRQKSIDAEKILRVHTSKTLTNVNNIAKALKKGNCAAIILCNSNVESHQLHHLISSANQGKTKCIMLNTQPTTIH